MTDGLRYYVYGVATAPAGAVAPPLGWVERPPLAVLCCPWQGPDPVVTRQLALAHARVVAAAAVRFPFVPCAAGNVVTGAELSDWLDGRRAPLCGALERLGGRVEFALKLWRRAPAAAPPAGGRAYLAQLRAESRLRAEARALVERLPAGLVTEVNYTEPPGLLLQAELLVARSDAERLRAAWAEIAAGLPADRGARLSGPWPPYYFAGVILNGEAGVGRQSGRCGAGAGEAGIGAGGTAPAVAGTGGGAAG